MGFRFIVLLMVAVLAAPGCTRRHCVPESIASDRNLVDLGASPDSHAPVESGITREVEAEFRRRVAARHPAGARPYQFLALSGGGMYGAFGVGVLKGWTDTGTRPQFDVVTGISTGSIISTFAFLGSHHDDLLKVNMSNIRRQDILQTRSAFYIPFADAVYNSRPLAKRIAEEITDEILAEVAVAHAVGRRLYIGTTNLDTQRLVMWDMGAIASRGTCESAELYRRIILASCSIPGVFPPVRIQVEIDGQQFDELHVDGGVSDEVIFRAFMVSDLNRTGGMPGAYAPNGSMLHVIGNGKLYSDPKCIDPALTKMMSASFRSIIYGKTRDELYRIYLNCLQTGVEFRLTAVPQKFRLDNTGGLSLSEADQMNLFNEGYRIGKQVEVVGDDWRDLPPGSDSVEQAMPRTGIRFATPRK